MESAILFVTGAATGGLAVLIAMCLCVASGNQKILNENAKMRKTIWKTCHDLEDLNAAVIKKTESYTFCKKIKSMQDELKKALREE